MDHISMIKKRHENQVILSKKKGRVSHDEFLVNDRVVIQDHISHKWEEEGVVVACRKADDASNQSFEIRMDSGVLKLRNKRFMKHVCKADNDSSRHVQFDTPVPQPDNSGRQEEQRAAESERGGPLTRSRTRTI